MHVKVRKGQATVIIGLLGILFCTNLIPANAAVTVYTDRSAWENAHDYPIEEEFFTDAVLNPAISVTSSQGVVDVTGVKGWGAGVWWDQLQHEVSMTTWTFVKPTYAYGGYWNLIGPGGMGKGIRLYLDGIEVSQFIPNTYNGGFWGLVSTIPFIHVLVTTPVPWDQGTEIYTLDNMVYTVPRIKLTKTDNLDPIETPCVSPGDEIIYTLRWENIDNVTLQNAFLTDYLPDGVSFEEIVNEGGSAFGDPPVDPNVVFGITDANGLDEITLPVGQSIRLYVTNETTNTNIYGFTLEVNSSDPNLGWIDNTEYDPNDPGTAEILATPRDEFYDYYGPGYTQYEGIQFSAVSFGNAMQDGNLASFLYTATQTGYVTLSLINYDTDPATLEEIVICQTDPNDPNNIPEEPNAPGDPIADPVAPPTGQYHPETRRITWDIGTLNPGYYSIVNVKVRVNIAAVPLGELVNRAVMTYGNESVEEIEITDVCCWDIGTIYVKTDANGLNNGTSWQDAFTELQDAIARANDRCSTIPGQIWVARGLYQPGDNTEDAFEIPANESVYGGFAGGETSIDQRNIKTNPTILSGFISEDQWGNIYRNETVVKMGNNSLLDGFIVKNSGALPAGYGIYGKDIDFTVSNCFIEDNQQFGLYANNGNLAVNWCMVQNNGWQGIYHIGSETESKSINIQNSLISGNGREGLYTEKSVPVIYNSQIGFNGTDSTDTFYGLYLYYPKTGYDIRNNTVIYNANEGIRIDKTDPNTPLVIYSCILYGNKVNSDEQLKGSVVTRYSCIWDPNNIYTTPDANHNISCDPNFAYDGDPNSDPNIVVYHLMADSPCIDKGQPGSYADQKDLDTEPREMGMNVDIGADEICPDCNDVYHPYDWNADGLINFEEFERLSRAWLTFDPNHPLCDPNNSNYISDPNDPGYISASDKERFNKKCDLNHDLAVNLGDLIILAEEDNWLWWACWRMDIWNMIEQQAQQSMLALHVVSSVEPSGVEGMLSDRLSIAQTAAASASEPIFETNEVNGSPVEPVEVFDPVAERSTILTLIEDIQVFIDAGGDDAQAWAEMKNLLEQSLADIEDMINGDAEI